MYPTSHKIMSPIAILSLIIVTNFICITLAFDQMPPQDFCVADPNISQMINGVFPCKDPKLVTAKDFYYTGIDKASNTSNPFKTGFTRVGVAAVPGLNTLGIAMVRMDMEAYGFYPPHLHPRATELLIVIKGQLEVGFVSPDQGYKYYNKTIKAGDVFAVPPRLIHFARNVGKEHSVSYVIFNSQNTGIDIVTQAVFGANPAIDANYLAASYQLDVKTINMLQGKNWPI